VSHLKLIIKKGKTAEELQTLFGAISKSPLTSLEIIDLDETMSLELGMQVLRGNTTLEMLRYTDDKAEPTQEKGEAIAGLVNGLKGLKLLIFNLSDVLWNSKYSTLILDSISKHPSIKTLKLLQVPLFLESELNFQQIKVMPLEGLCITAITSKLAKRDFTSNTWTSLLDSMGSMPLKKLKMNVAPISEEATVKFTETIHLCKNIETLKISASSHLGTHLASFIKDSKTLKYLEHFPPSNDNLKVSQQSTLTILASLKDSTSIERLHLQENLTYELSLGVVKVVRECKSLKEFRFMADVFSKFGDGNSRQYLMDALDANTSLRYGFFYGVTNSNFPSSSSLESRWSKDDRYLYIYK
jgi:hypothetical protein